MNVESVILSSEADFYDSIIEEALFDESAYEVVEEVKEEKEKMDKELLKKTITDNNIIRNEELSTARFSKAEWFEKMQEMNILLAGIGGIGSNAAYTLGHLHPAEMVLIDPDIVDEVNLAGQFFDYSDIGNKKADVIKRKLYALHDHYSRIYSFNRLITENDRSVENKDIVIAGFDNMDARKNLYYSWKKRGKENSLFIDGRMSVNVFQLFTMTKNQKDRMEEYEDKWLFDQSESDSNVCSYKQTYFCATMMSGVITSLCINYAQNLLLEEEIWPVPFFIEEDTTLLSRTVK